ncbi:hypothetical protein L6164_003090 [Bauhinia variegata]|uniref:Uncharacterized protein n=1 Tax=Bauhinia variegata TaxID=167791 RepID=A0ACB9Q5Q5_BAUVA|nr:hypothetical protein L6164_003090 [Bauhinia variegata]
MSAVDLDRKRNNFADNVQKTLTRFHDQCLAIREFKLHKHHSGSFGSEGSILAHPVPHSSEEKDYKCEEELEVANALNLIMGDMNLMKKLK